MADTSPPVKLQPEGAVYARGVDEVLLSRRLAGDVHSRMVLTADGRLLSGDGTSAPGAGGASSLATWLTSA